MKEELFTVIAGSAARPGTPAALWIGSRDGDRGRRRAVRTGRAYPVVARWFAARRFLRRAAARPGPDNARSGTACTRSHGAA